MFIKERLTQYRVAKGLSKLRLSELAGLSSSHITELEKGHKIPTAPTIEKLAIALEIDPEALVIDNVVGRNLTWIRLQKGMTMKDLEVRCELSAGHICKIEKGKRKKPSVDTLNKIAEALRVSLEDFYTIREEYMVRGA